MGSEALKGGGELISVYKAENQEIVGPIESITNEDVNKMLTSTKLPNRGYQISEIMI